ncbi:glutamate ligase domain-containing protein [Microcella frigidaquae]|uniref:UDP-N-acetylmuramoyl-tripeptide--D-alanyl-D-alanine ligase n=1 Tax=Microcella frigidaquae TaxID=424758 RepID=A0A840X2Y0_9MICO|nr:UDP-N-acetylmuramoyl-tripeptide--D-alanyl-D-alanine ligase [Microcella frigidaquae]NHN43718.1 hypothetical protein [Microcella frigidaquae]
MSPEPPVVRIDDVRHRSTGSVAMLSIDGTAHELALAVLGDAAVERAVGILTAALAAGDGLEIALAAAAALEPEPGRLALRRAASGALLIDDAAAATPVEARAALRVLADIARDRRRSFAVMGELDTSAADWFDEHDALGRIVVRLDVSQLIVIGHGARHLHNAAGLEGSWDGESVLVDTPDDAYDVLRARLDPEDVVLVTAGARTALGDLVDRLVAGDA